MGGRARRSEHTLAKWPLSLRVMRFLAASGEVPLKKASMTRLPEGWRHQSSSSLLS